MRSHFLIYIYVIINQTHYTKLLHDINHKQMQVKIRDNQYEQKYTKRKFLPPSDQLLYRILFHTHKILRAVCKCVCWGVSLDVYHCGCSIKSPGGGFLPLQELLLSLPRPRVAARGGRESAHALLCSSALPSSLSLSSSTTAPPPPNSHSNAFLTLFCLYGS